MNPRICICCGEAMVEHAASLSRNPNLCASCSSLADGIHDETALSGLAATDSPAEKTRAELAPEPEPAGILGIS